MDSKKAWIGLHGMEGEKDWTTKGKQTKMKALEWIGFINCWIDFGASLKSVFSTIGFIYYLGLG